MCKPTRMLCVLLLSTAANAGPLYRCQADDGVLRYTDRSCPGRGAAIDAGSLAPNTYDAEPDDAAVVSPRGGRQSAARQPKAGQATCNNAADLRHIDLMLGSLVTDKQQRRFLQSERQRVQKCQLTQLSWEQRQRRDAALRRLGALRDSERAAAEREIKDIYAGRTAREPAARH